MSNQGNVQASVRTRSGVTAELDWNGDWHYLWDQEGIADGTFNERMLTWINTELGETYTNLPGAMQAYAESLGFYNWSSMTAIDPGVFDPVSLFGGGETGFIYDLSDSSTVFVEVEGNAPVTPTPNNNVLGTLLDLSGNDNHCAAASVFARPTWLSAGYATFNGFDDYLRASFTLNQPATIIASLRIVTDSLEAIAIGGGIILYQRSAGTLSIVGSGSFLGELAFDAGEDFVVTYRASGATSRLARNAEAYLTGDNPGSNALAGVSFAASIDGSGTFTEMRLYRAVGIGRDLTDDEIADVRTWCAATAGITL